MLKTVGLLIKISAFSAVILVLGNWLRWDGKTVSDQVRMGMAHAERTELYGSVRSWAEKLTHDAQKGLQRRIHAPASHAGHQVSPQEDISSSERQKLKALIQELNSSYKKD